MPNQRDDSPDTPTGVQVDKRGCLLDGDSDGVPNYLDQCPTELGTAALFKAQFQSLVLTDSCSSLVAG